MSQLSKLIFTPQSLINRALQANFITQLDIIIINPIKLMELAQSVAEDWTNSWPRDQGFGSSDFTYALQDFLHGIGKQTDFVNGRLTVINSNINKITEN